MSRLIMHHREEEILKIEIQIDIEERWIHLFIHSDLPNDVNITKIQNKLSKGFPPLLDVSSQQEPRDVEIQFTSIQIFEDNYFEEQLHTKDQIFQQETDSDSDEDDIDIDMPESCQIGEKCSTLFIE
jgi:hypothetical protein